MSEFYAEVNDSQPKKLPCVDIEKIEDEYVLTSAEYLLSLAQVKWKFTGKSLLWSN